MIALCDLNVSIVTSSPAFCPLPSSLLRVQLANPWPNRFNTMQEDKTYLNREELVTLIAVLRSPKDKKDLTRAQPNLRESGSLKSISTAGNGLSAYVLATIKPAHRPLSICIFRGHSNTFLEADEDKMTQLRLVLLRWATVRMARLNTAHNSQLPIGRLPDEILSEIFLFCIPRKEANLWEVPLIFVCWGWRHCALGSSRFWSCVRYDASAISASKPHITALRHWVLKRTLTQAQYAPLHLDLRSSDFPNYANGDLSEIVLILSPYLSQVRSVAYHGLLHLGDAWNSLFLQTPALEEINIEVSDRHGSQRSILPSPPPPSLRSLTLVGKRAGTVTIAPLQLHYLTYLRLDQSIGVEAVLDLLEGCANLETLIWAGGSELRGQEIRLRPDRQAVVLSCLTVADLGSDALIAFLTKVKAPDVEQLALAQSTASAIISGLGQLKKLSFLRLRGFSSIEPETIEGLFQLFSDSLRDFSFDSWTKQSLTALRSLGLSQQDVSTASPRSPLCPHLRRLEISFEAGLPPLLSGYTTRDRTFMIAEYQRCLSVELEKLMISRAGWANDPLRIWVNTILLDISGPTLVESKYSLDWEAVHFMIDAEYDAEGSESQTGDCNEGEEEDMSGPSSRDDSDSDDDVLGVPFLDIVFEEEEDQDSGYPSDLDSDGGSYYSSSD
ncbi:hypothetical protein DL93DRAFT_359292 [Clavulina sp. PMI_390]|nr:hypothetical protein DL93DRAFT_359292 [Clavulina sp. PMI_390]